MPVDALLPLPVVALNVTIRIQALLLLLSSAFPKFTVIGVLLNAGPVVIIDGDVVKGMNVFGLSPNA
jgi:hypothetical protein